MTESSLLTEIADDGAALLTLHRPAQRNALDEGLICALTSEVLRLARRREVRSIVITGGDEVFCAGTDIAWMEQVAGDQPGSDARLLGNLLWQLRTCPKPTLARVGGSAMGAGLAVALACDIAVAADDAEFALPAVRIGIVPSVIGAFVTEAVGPSVARRYMMTGETFSADDARRLGFVHANCLKAHLDATVAGFTRDLAAGGPDALAETKRLLNEYAGAPLSKPLLDGAAKVSAEHRRTSEAREGLAAFIEKRPPSWVKG